MHIEICIVTKKMTNGTIAVNEFEFLLPKLLSSISTIRIKTGIKTMLLKL
ncbi:hypothetical protein EC07E033_28920 [Escherichia coli]|nr:hypothetical protein EC07E033_28920 [Escherichia coli]